MTADKTASVAESLWSRGVLFVEVPLHSQTSVEAFRSALSVRPKVGESFLGVGSVRNMKDYAFAVELGADFTVSPGLFPDVCRVALENNLLHLPGVFTPTEVGLALDLGYTNVKVFPAAALGPQGFRALLDPYPEISLLAVGGINLTNAPDFIAAGAVGVGIGSAITHQTNGLEQSILELKNITRLTSR